MARHPLLILLLSIMLFALLTVKTGRAESPLKEVFENKAVDASLETTDLSIVANWVFDSGQLGSELGYSVGITGDVNGDGYDDVLIGSPLYIPPGSSDKEGAVLVFYGASGGLSEEPDWIVGNGKAGSRFGSAVSGAGDVNGDGFDDIIVGAEDYKLNFDGYTGEPKSGAAFLYLGSEDGLSETPDWIVYAEAAAISFGFSVGSAGDVNDDGFDDIIIGAPYYESSSEQNNEGKVYVYLGSETGPGEDPDWIYECNLPNSSCGYAVNAAGDVNGDGYDDVVVGTPHYDNLETNEGAVLLFYGSADGPSAWANWIADIDQQDAWFGVSVASAGDVNQDGYADLIVGASNYDLGDDQTDFGAAFVYLGSPTGPGLTYDWAVFGDEEYSGFGRSVASAGDINQDGFSDVLIGAYLLGQSGSVLQPDEGAVYLYTGRPTGLESTPGWWAYGNKAETWFGFSTGATGDINGDGGVDIIVGAPKYRIETEIFGRAFVFLNTLTNEQPYEVFIPIVIGQ
jgi:hypothetical protein